MAAANPALKTLRFPLTAVGLTVSSDTSGRIDVKDDAGTLRFSSPAPLQWDSSKAAPSAPQLRRSRHRRPPSPLRSQTLPPNQAAYPRRLPSPVTVPPSRASAPRWRAARSS
ncbi:hypothetical protein ACFQ0M_45835 [Kitasatospora aburaviensis]